MESVDEAMSTLRKAYKRGEVTVYLGAGVSVGNGLPTWEKLVLAMYFSALSKQWLGIWRPFPNYLFAIAEWHLERGHEPLEIIARKIQKYYEDEQNFLDHLRDTLYAGFIDTNEGTLIGMNSSAIRVANTTLDAVARLCEKRTNGRRGVKSVISYNYDCLLEILLGDMCQPIYRAQSLKRGMLPVYHVHGYVPLEGDGSVAHEIIFTEEQYHLAAQDAYSWSNLVQIQCMSGSTGLMIGLSLSDRNMRRLLDAVSGTPIDTKNYVLLQEPQWRPPDDTELRQIDDKARLYFERFETSGVKRAERYGIGLKGGPTWQEQIREIIKEVQRVDVKEQTFVLEQLGVQPVWYGNHSEIPTILAAIWGN